MNALLAFLAPLGSTWLLCSAIVGVITARDVLMGVRGLGWRFALVLVCLGPVTLALSAYLAWTEHR